MALGIAGTQAAGLKSQFGTMCKPFHAGKAAQNGLLAARLAARGFSSRTDLLECVQGFAATHGPDFSPEAALAAPADGFHILANLFKYHAACYMTHAPIETARQARREHGLSPDQIAGITLRLDAGCDRICNIPAPVDGLQSKFSLRQTVAMALAGIDTASLGAYSEENARDPALIRLRERMTHRFSARLAVRPWPRSRSPSPTAGGSRRGTMPAFPRPTSPSRATGSPPNSMSWSGRCSAPRAPASCGKRSAGSTPWPRSAASRGSPRASLRSPTSAVCQNIRSEP